MKSERKFTLVIAFFFHLSWSSYSQVVSLDSSFGTSGKVLTDFNTTSEYGHAVAIQSDGKIVVAGNRYDGSYNDFGVVRYNTDGSLDTTFNTTGKVITSIDSFADNCNSITIQSDGKILAAGDSYNGIDYDFALVRYNTNGTIDTTFDGDGIITTDIGSFHDQGTSVVIQGDGKIIVAGSSSDGSYTDFALVRYNTNGSIDTSFDTDGKITTDIGTVSDNANAVTLQSDGKILVAGDSYNGTDFDFATVRYNVDGSLDTTFDTDGKVTTSISITTTGLGSGYDRGTSVAIQDDGKIVVSGYIPSNQFALVRYNTDGSLDTTFDNDGKVTTPIGGFMQGGTSVAIQTDGKILLAGDDNTGSTDDLAVARYNSNGSLDSTFDADGIITAAMGPYYEGGDAIALQSDGKIVVAGFAINGADADFFVVRYNNNVGTGINTIDELKDGLVIYPNPSNGNLSIRWAGGEKAILRINNLLGEEILHGQLTDNMQLRLLQKGIYFIRIYTDQEDYTKRIVIE